MNAWCITTDRDIKVLQDSLKTSFLWNNTVISLQEHIIQVKQTHANLADANAPVNDNDKRLFFSEQVGGNFLLAQSIDKYLDSAASPTVGGAAPDPPSFHALTTYMTTFISLRTKDEPPFSTHSLLLLLQYPILQHLNWNHYVRKFALFDNKLTLLEEEHVEGDHPEEDVTNFHVQEEVVVEITVVDQFPPLNEIAPRILVTARFTVLDNITP